MQEVMNKKLPINFSFNSHRCRGLIILLTLQHMQEVINTKLSINFRTKSHRYRELIILLQTYAIQLDILPFCSEIIFFLLSYIWIFKGFWFCTRKKDICRKTKLSNFIQELTLFWCILKTNWNCNNHNPSKILTSNLGISYL